MNELPAHTDVLVVGAGFAGLAMAERLGRASLDHVVVERGDDVGGTWRDNHYPGAACDVPSQLYSLGFARNPDWSHSFSRQPEILDYLRRVAADLGLADRLHLRTELLEARWDDDAARWLARTNRGEIAARFLINAGGGLADPRLPDVPGIESFGGEMWHSAQWRHDVDLTGKRVAVVGTGASAIQFVPHLVERASSVVLLQRTPPWVIPRMDRRISALERRLYRRVPAVQRAVRQAISWGRESYVLGFAKQPAVMRVVQRIAEAHLRRQVPDPDLRALLTPHYAPGCKRILISNDYYPALTREHVEVIGSGLARVEPNAVVTADGRRREVDVLVFGTGFLITDQPIAHRLVGREGRRLAEVWGDTMWAHKSAAVAGFPNFFFAVGPNSGLGHTSQVLMIEAQADYAARAIVDARRRGADVIEVRRQAERTWDAQVQSRMGGTVWATGGCSSWYVDRAGRISVLWPGTAAGFRRALRRFDPQSYRYEMRPPSVKDAGVPEQEALA